MPDDQRHLASLAFTAVTAIQDGLLDQHLPAIWAAVRERRALTDPSRPPSWEPSESHQVWVWMQHQDRTPCWEIRGTGAIFQP